MLIIISALIGGSLGVYSFYPKENAEDFYLKGNMAYDSSKYGESMQLFSSAISINPKYAAAYRNRGFSENKIGKDELAISDYNRAMELGLSDAIVYDARGMSESALQKYNPAIADYKKALELDPNYFQAYINIGWIAHLLGKDSIAIMDYNKALTFNLDFAITYNDRALSEQSLGEYSQALIDINKALALDSKIPSIRYNKGYIEFHAGDTIAAGNDMKAAAQSGDNDAKEFIEKHFH